MRPGRSSNLLFPSRGFSSQLTQTKWRKGMRVGHKVSTAFSLRYGGYLDSLWKELTTPTSALQPSKQCYVRRVVWTLAGWHAKLFACNWVTADPWVRIAACQNWCPENQKLAFHFVFIPYSGQGLAIPLDSRCLSRGGWSSLWLCSSQWFWGGGSRGRSQSPRTPGLALLSFLLFSLPWWVLCETLSLALHPLFWQTLWPIYCYFDFRL